MNYYYSNLIEGHNTHPRSIDQALANDLSKNVDCLDKGGAAGFGYAEAVRIALPLRGSRAGVFGIVSTGLIKRFTIRKPKKSWSLIALLKP
jgi:hypothetical protein